MRTFFRAAGWCVLLLAAAPAFSQIEPEARNVLAASVKAYGHLKTIEMETTYSGDSGGFIKPVRSRLLLQRPNRLLYEVWHNVPGMGRTTVKRYLCDGRDYYIYDETEGYYSRFKAPKDLKQLGIAGAGVELAAISGSNPFDGLEKQVRAARLEGVAEVNGQAADVVMLDSGNQDRTGEARFYISRSDHLILRFTFESIHIDRPDKKPPPLPRLNPDDPPEQELHQPPVKFSYDNKYILNPSIPASAFAWTTPPGAMLYEPLSQILDKHRFADRPAYMVVGKKGKPQKALTYRELLEQAKKQRRIR